MKFFIALIALCNLFYGVWADTPANCTYEDMRGTWNLMEGQRGLDKTIDCTCFQNFTSNYYVTLSFPNIATDEDGNVGFWTLIYNQGVEIVINGRKYFAFSYYEQNGTTVTSYCDRTFTMTSHNVGVNAPNWSCYKAVKVSDLANTKRVHKIKTRKLAERFLEKTLYKTNSELIDKINNGENKWVAGHYDFLNERSLADLVRMAGGKKSRYNRPKPVEPTLDVKLESLQLPDQFDWRNVSGVNFVSPVRDQGSCGSCYSYGSMAMHEARLRVKTYNQNQTVFSTQDIVSCSPYSQGCEGGFPYLVAGKYAEDYGLVAEQCNPYKGIDSPCQTDPTCSRNYGTAYKYVGGFYGACNEDLMKIALVKDGPIAVSFEVYDDFFNYKGGIYHHTGLQDKQNFGFNPWEITNHVVLIVGYGVDSVSGTKYWIVKNSWSTSWGEQGFFRIMRGNDECSIESIAVEADIIV